MYFDKILFNYIHLLLYILLYTETQLYGHFSTNLKSREKDRISILLYFDLLNMMDFNEHFILRSQMVIYLPNNFIKNKNLN